MLKSLLITQLLSFVLIIHGAGQRLPDDQHTSRCFKEYVSGISDSIQVVELDLSKEYFPLFTVGSDQLGRRITVTAFDRDYLVGIAQNVFVRATEDPSMQSCQVVVYARARRQLAVFQHASIEPIQCRSYISFLELAPFSSGGYVFDQNYQVVAEFYHDFQVKSGKAAFTFFRYHDGIRFSAVSNSPGLAKFNHHIDLLLQYKGYKSYLDLIFNPRVDDKKLRWRVDTVEQDFYREFMENTIGRKSPSAFQCEQDRK